MPVDREIFKDHSPKKQPQGVMLFCLNDCNAHTANISMHQSSTTKNRLISIHNLELNCMNLKLFL